MASTVTIEQVKELIKQELAPVQVKLGKLANQFGELEKTPNFLSGRYDSLLKHMQDTNKQVRTANQKLNTQSSQIAALKDETHPFSANRGNWHFGNPKNKVFPIQFLLAFPNSLLSRLYFTEI